MADSETTSPTQDDAEDSATRALLGLVDIPGVASAAVATIAAPLGQALLGIVAPLDTVSSAVGLGRKLLDVASSVAATTTQPLSEILAGEPRQASERVVDATTPPPWPSLIADLAAEMVEEHSPGSPSVRGIRSVLREIGDLVVSFQTTTGIAAVGQLPNDTLRKALDEKVKRLLKFKKLLDKLTKFFPDLTAPRFRKALLDMGSELKGPAADRAVIAAFMSVPGFLVDFATALNTSGSEAPSTKEIGNEVQEILQRRYRSFWRSPRFIARSISPFAGPLVQESKVYLNPIRGIPLHQYAESTTDGRIQALLIARLPAYLAQQHLLGNITNRVWGEYREDNLDFQISELWEIKPMRSVALGVFQEFHYRHSFKVVYALLQDLADLVSAGGGKKGDLGKRAKFFGRFDFSRPLALEPGLDVAWGPLKQPETVTGKGTSKALLAVPLTVPQLPGQLMYLLLDIPLPALLAFSALLAKKLQEAIEKMARDYAREVEDILAEVAKWAYRLLALMGMIVVGYLFWELIAAAAAGAALAPALKQLLDRFAPQLLPALPGLTALGTNAGERQLADVTEATSSSAQFIQTLVRLARDAQLTSVAPARVVKGELIVQFAPIAPQKGGSIPIIDMTMGPLCMLGMPASARPIIDLVAQAGAAVGAGAFSEFLGEPQKQA